MEGGFPVGGARFHRACFGGGAQNPKNLRRQNFAKTEERRGQTCSVGAQTVSSPFFTYNIRYLVRRVLSDKKLRLGVDFWCDYYIMVEEWNYSEGSIFCQTYDENEKLRMKYDR